MPEAGNNDQVYNGFQALRKEFRTELEKMTEEGPAVQGPKGDSVTAGREPPTEIIPGVSVFIDAVSGEVYRYEKDE